MKDIEKSSAEKIETLILDTLKDLIKNGIDKKMIEKVESELVELPEKKKRRFMMPLMLLIMQIYLLSTLRVGY